MKRNLAKSFLISADLHASTQLFNKGKLLHKKTANFNAERNSREGIDILPSVNRNNNEREMGQTCAITIERADKQRVGLQSQYQMEFNFD